MASKCDLVTGRPRLAAGYTEGPDSLMTTCADSSYPPEGEIHVLLVFEDYPAIADATRTLLHTMNFTVCQVSDAGQALGMFRQGLPRVVICHHLPYRPDSCVEVIETVRRASGEHIPAIVLSLDPSPSLVSQLAAAAPCQLLGEPVDAELLLHTIRTLAPPRKAVDTR